MTEPVCALEERVRAALARGGLDPELRAHAHVCPVCREVAAVSDWVGRLRGATLEEYAAGRSGARIPEAGAILDRARSRGIPGNFDTPEILKPLRIYRRIALPAGLAAGFVVAVLNASAIKALLISLPGMRTLLSGFEAGASGMSPAFVGFFWGMAGLGLLSILALAAATGFKRAER
jgi:hypothetical protein